METEFNGVKIVVDELHSCRLLFDVLPQNADGYYLDLTFPDGDVVEEIKRLITSKYSELRLYFFRLKIDTGGGDEVSLNLYAYAKTECGCKINCVSGHFNILISSERRLQDISVVFEAIDELFDTLSYAVRLYEKTKLRLDAYDELYESDICRLKEIGVDLGANGRVSDADMDRVAEAWFGKP